MTATERRFSFELPLEELRIAHGLYGAAGILGRKANGAATQIVAGDNAPAAVLDQGLEQLGAPGVATAVQNERSTEQTGSTTAPCQASSDRHSALALPAPIMEHERRG